MTLPATIRHHLEQAISDATRREFRCLHQHAVGGGCINSSYVVEDGVWHFFVKINAASRQDMFEAEAAGLHEIIASATVRAPRPVCWGTAGAQSYLVLEHLPLGHESNSAQEELGRALARMHRHTAKHYGWWRDNTVGSTPQPNGERDTWLAFWRDQRLGFQLQLAAGNGYRGRLQRRGEQLLLALDTLLTGHNPPPSLLHGDLWSGNYAVLTSGEPVIFDPAVYYGDRETDLAMTELFGGFGPAFYRGYENEYPLPDGYSQRKTLYNLYHILNHLNLFGGGYAQQAERMMEQLLTGY